MSVQRYRQTVKVAARPMPMTRLLWGSLIAAVGIVSALTGPASVKAAVHVTSDTPFTQNALKVETVGYQVVWLENLTNVAQEAFRNDQHQLARRVWVALADEGNSEAAYRLGMLYDTGTGVERDSVEAASWYQQAAEGGNLDAQHNLAVAYANGDGVELNISKAMHWWKSAAQRGNADSQYNLGIVYAMGVHGIQKNLDNAKKWWRKAAIKGDPMAQYNLGTIYANGDNHVRSYCEATRWWEKSAKMGIEQAGWALQIIKQRDDYKACW